MLIHYPEFLDALQGLFITDISSDQIGELAMYQIQNNPEWTFETYSLYGTGDTDISSNFGGYVYVMKMDEESIERARKYIDDVLEGIVPDTQQLLENTEEVSKSDNTENKTDKTDDTKKVKEGDLNESKTN